MKQLPKFLIAHNVAANPDGLYLIHTQEPRFIALVIPQAGEIKTIDKIMHEFPVGSRTNRLPSGEWFIVGVIEFYDTPDEDKLPKLMSRTGEWLFNHMKNLPK